jgi:hypothetical protein
MKITKNDILFTLALICAAWFMLTGIVWVYLAALFIAYPFGLISFLLWLSIRNENKKRTKIIPIALGIGLLLSLSVLVYMLIWE